MILASEVRREGRGGGFAWSEFRDPSDVLGFKLLMLEDVIPFRPELSEFIFVTELRVVDARTGAVFEGIDRVVTL